MKALIPLALTFVATVAAAGPVVAVPEPGTLGLVLLGAAALVVARRRRK
jgi:PEP-CTERM motif